MKPALSPAQSRALALAAEYGRLIRLRGGLWVTQHFADCETRTPKRSEYAGTQTVNALKERGLLTLTSNIGFPYGALSSLFGNFTSSTHFKIFLQD